MAGSRIVPVCLFLLFIAFFPNSASVSSSVEQGSHAFSCEQVQELFEGKIGSPASLLSNATYESELSICRRGSKVDHLSCCSIETERKFAEIAETKLKENLHTRNHVLKKHIKNILAKYQDRLLQITLEAQNRTSLILTKLHKIPWTEHDTAVTGFFTSIQQILDSSNLDVVDEVVRDFFKNLFPAVFDFVLSTRGQGEGRPSNQEYHACLKRYADQIQPFGNVPDQLLRYLRRSFQHSFIFRDTLSTLVNSVTSTEMVSMDDECRKALVRLQVCSGCRGVSARGAEVKPCRGMCLNVMRGCLAKISEISSSWDDLIVAFENLQMVMMGHYELQKFLTYVDMNITDAIMLAMDDSPRIYDEVIVKCQSLSVSRADKDLLAINSSSLGDTKPLRSVDVLPRYKDEFRTLIKYLEDSKGMFNRLADNVCQDSVEYEQDMQSVRCWNGSTVGRYLEEVPEANFLSQARRNTEVKVSLKPEYDLLQVKDTIDHMQRNLSGLLNTDIMQSDAPNSKPPAIYKNVDGSGQDGRQDVIIDDEDLVAYGSGSASGSGYGGTPEREDSDENITPTKPDRGTVKPQTTRSPPTGGSESYSLSFSLLSACVLLLRLIISP